MKNLSEHQKSIFLREIRGKLWEDFNVVIKDAFEGSVPRDLEKFLSTVLKNASFKKIPRVIQESLVDKYEGKKVKFIAAYGVGIVIYKGLPDTILSVKGARLRNTDYSKKTRIFRDTGEKIQIKTQNGLTYIGSMMSKVLKGNHSSGEFCRPSI